MRVSWIALLFLILPLAEIAGFVIVGQLVGVWATLGLVLLSGLLGLLLLRLQGLQMLKRLSQEGREGRVPGNTIIQGAMIVVAALLLLIPGFVSDVIGIALFIPFVRGLLWQAIGRRMVIINTQSSYSRSNGFERHGAGSDGPVVDLDDEDFRREPNLSSPWSGHQIRDD